MGRPIYSLYFQAASPSSEPGINRWFGQTFQAAYPSNFLYLFYRGAYGLLSEKLDVSYDEAKSIVKDNEDDPSYHECVGIAFDQFLDAAESMGDIEKPSDFAIDVSMPDTPDTRVDLRSFIRTLTDPDLWGCECFGCDRDPLIDFKRENRIKWLFLRYAPISTVLEYCHGMDIHSRRIQAEDILFARFESDEFEDCDDYRDGQSLSEYMVGKLGLFEDDTDCESD
nr:hypothetical protein TetV2_00283 [Oceanusvirus sp.]